MLPPPTPCANLPCTAQHTLTPLHALAGKKLVIDSFFFIFAGTHPCTVPYYRSRALLYCVGQLGVLSLHPTRPRLLPGSVGRDSPVEEGWGGGGSRGGLYGRSGEMGPSHHRYKPWAALRCT